MIVQTREEQRGGRKPPRVQQIMEIMIGGNPRGRPGSPEGSQKTGSLLASIRAATYSRQATTR